LSSPQEPARVSVRILEKEYFITCPYEERSALLDSAEFLNARMREVRDSGKVVGLDRIAVMVALNLTNELLQLKSNAKVENEAGTRVRNMRERVEARLAAGQSSHKSDSRSDKSRQSENGRQLEL
jgi:cell division protein ZapA